MRTASYMLRHLGRPRWAWLALAAAIALTLIGIAAITTAEPRYGPIQLRWLVIALVVAGGCVLPHPRIIGRAAYPLMAVMLLVLTVIILPFMPRSIVPVRNGATCWINLRVMMFQPSEITKIIFVLAMAWYLRYGDSWRTWGGLLRTFVMLAVPVGLILLEPDLGTAMLFPPALFAMLVAAGARLWHLSLLIGLAVLAVVVNVAMVFVLPDSMQVLKPHQRQRIVAMVSQVRGEDRYQQDIGYQQHKAMTLVGSGRWSGYGAEGARTIVQFNRLPEDHNDMIFAVIVNRWGFVGGAATLGLYLALVISFLAVAATTKDAFARLSVVGFSGLLLSQAAINIAIPLGLMPVTGITLPFVSYGGSSLVATFTMVGLVFNFASRRPTLLTRPSFEFDRAEALA